MRINLLFLAIFALAAVAISGCAAPSPTITPTPQAVTPTPTAPVVTPTPGASLTPSPTSGAPSTASVGLSGFTFQPEEVTIAKGGTVTWTNNDGTPHTVKFADGESPVLPNKGSYSKKFDVAGTFAYICGIHPTMKGTVIVV